MKCRYPIEIHCKSTGHSYLVPCNKCPECLTRRKQQWIHRIDCEKRYGNFKNCYFVTLTYDDLHLPFESYRKKHLGIPVDPVSTGESLLNPYDLRCFIERLRFVIKDGFTYFACGEYGDPKKTKRPHFHLILFTNQDWNNCVLSVRLAWSKVRAESRHERYVRSKNVKLGINEKRDKLSMENRISYGRSQVKSVTYKRICYVAKYVNKILGIDDIVPPYYTCSHGLGKGFLKSDEAKLLRRQNIRYAHTSKGLPTAISRYYSTRLFSADQNIVFNMQQSDISSPPDHLLSDPKALKEWYHYQCVVEKERRRVNLLRYHHVRMLL